MDENVSRRVEETEKELHLTKHRLSVLEAEQLPRRVASMEPIVQRMEHKLDDLGSQIDKGLEEVKSAILAQKSLQKGVIMAVAVMTGIIQFVLPYVERVMP